MQIIRILVSATISFLFLTMLGLAGNERALPGQTISYGVITLILFIISKGTLHFKKSKKARLSDDKLLAYLYGLTLGASLVFLLVLIRLIMVFANKLLISTL